MRDLRVAVGLVGSLITLGCGRFGFSGSGDQTTALGGDAMGSASPVPCMETSFRVSENTDRAYVPRLVWNGTEAGMAWMEDPIPDAVHFRTVALDGTTDPIASPGILAQGEAVDLGWDGTSWRLTWADDDPNREVMASTDGAAPSALTASSRQDMRARIAAMSGGKVAYLWATDQPSTGYDLRLAVVDAAGAKLVSDLVVATTADLNTHSLVWTGSELAVFYPAGKSLTLLRLHPDGSRVVDPITVGTLTDTFPFVSASWAGDRFLVAWNSANGIRFAYMGLDGALVFPAVGAAASTQWTDDVSVAIGPTSDALAWSDLNGASYVQEMLHDGTIGEVHTFSDAYYPSVAWVGTRWAVALSQRVYPTPAHPDPQPDFINLIQICSSSTQGAAAR
ncbi:MAG TPA: hypothetical protein VFT22_18800 [Kofleriaceae bacterium]|nr:hypothetical protein [Kofleriaceae bacterium]